MAFEDGVRYYTYGTVYFKTSFPEDRVVCSYCKFIRSRSDLKRYECILTDEILLYPFDGIGLKCPVIFENEENEESEEK